MRSFIVVLVAMAGLAMAVPALGAKYDFQVSPSVGTPRTTFKVSFRAPFSADGIRRSYDLSAIGPPGCVQVYEFASRVRRGRRVVMRLTPLDDILLPTRLITRWCRGAYVGYVDFTGPRRSLVIGTFSFGVDHQPVNLAE